MAFPENKNALVGNCGVAESALRPAGVARFDQKRLSVIPEGGFIEKDTEVEIVSAKGFRIVVRAAESKTG